MRYKKRDLKATAVELHAVLKRQTASIVTAGDLLREAREQLEHGEWLPWLKNGFELSERSAYRYMKASEFASKFATVANLELSNLSPSALYALSDGEYSPAAIQAILKETVSKRVDKDRANEIALPIVREELEAEHAEAFAEARAKREAEQSDEAEAEAWLDEPPPELPPTDAPTSSIVLLSAQQEFDKAIATLAQLAAMPAKELRHTMHPAERLAMIAVLLQQIAKCLEPVESALE